MCLTMVIIHTKTLERKKAVDYVTSKATDSELKPQTMSKGPTLFSCGAVESDGWRDRGRSCAFQREPGRASLESLWDVLPEACQGRGGWTREPGAASTITSLIRDLSLSDAKAAPPAAPPSKRQCCSLSLSDEPGSGRVWRPQGSRVWTAVEKRRCHSGGSVTRGPSSGGGLAGYPIMQRSSSFSLPARSNALPLNFELPCLAQRLPGLPFTGFQPSPSSPSSHRAGLDPSDPARPLSLSHEQICPLGQRRPSASSSPDSTPELGRRARPGGLARSRSQPCVLNDKKIGMKRRRPEDAQEKRPSLDLAKMTQKLQNFHSLSGPGITAADLHQALSPRGSPGQCAGASAPGGDPDMEPRQNTDEEGRENGEYSSNEELDFEATGGGGSKREGVNGKQECGASWQEPCVTGKDVFRLGEELDIEQIERN
ncbi:protein FAM53B isoform X2 [Amia ocellicauda]|uniref:protein FAM53B isoform X2 n=1 Tax=Amia ocellicauda TaxID=2972642 RepID=UPI0034645DC3